MVSRAVILCGTETTDPPMRTLTAGPLSAQFDNGALRYIRFDGVEALRGIAFLVRDENWGTFTPKIENLRIDETADAFTVRYQGTCADVARELVYHASIIGRRDGSLEFEVVAEPRTDVLTNRTGFVVLHPAGVAGQSVRVLHTNGREEAARFPRTCRPALPLLRHPRPVARDRARRPGDLYDGRRRLRDGGPAQLDRRLIQDLHTPPRQTPALHAAEG